MVFNNYFGLSSDSNLGEFVYEINPYFELDICEKPFLKVFK